MRAKNTPNDPERRQRILTATMTLLETSGISAVTARNVAREAGVPVGSVSYHHNSLRALLLEASHHVVELRGLIIAEWKQDVTPETVRERLADLVHQQITDGRPMTVAAYELSLLGLRDPEFSVLSTSAVRQLRRCLEQFCDPPTARRLAALADGLQMQSLYEDPVPTRHSLRNVITASG